LSRNLLNKAAPDKTVPLKWLVKIFFEILIKTGIVIFGLGIIFYSITVSRNWNRFDFFIFLFGLFGLMLIIAAAAFGRIIRFIKKFPKWLKITGLALICIFAVSFIITEAIIISGMRQNAPQTKTDYVIVLGCQVVGIYPSVPLIRRVNAAENYLKDHEDVKVIVSGGQGPGEAITEAEAMRKLLTDRGMDKERILTENRSSNTKENLMFSDELYNLKEKNIVIVTTDYHMFRSLAIAKKLGLKNVSALPSRSQRSALPVYLFREYFAVMLYAITGRI